MTKTKKPSLPPEEVARIIEKTTRGNASEFARRMGVNKAVVRKYAREGISVEAIAWTFRVIDKNPALLGGPVCPGVSDYDRGYLTAISEIIAVDGLPKARALVLAAGLENANIAGLSTKARIILRRLNTYHGIDLVG